MKQKYYNKKSLFYLQDPATQSDRVSKEKLGGGDTDNKNLKSKGGQLPSNNYMSGTVTNNSDSTIEIDIQELERLKLENDTLKNKLSKALADYVNLEKDIDRRAGIQVANMKRAAEREIISVLNDVYLGITKFYNKSIDKDSVEELKNWIEGVFNLMTKMETVLKAYDLERVNIVIGDQFDPSIAESIAIVESEDYQTGQIIDIIAYPYRSTINNTVVHLGKVIVCKNSN